MSKKKKLNIDINEYKYINEVVKLRLNTKITQIEVNEYKLK